MSEENKAVARRLYEEVINTGDLERVNEFVSADVVDHDPALPEHLHRSPEGFKYLVSMARDIFPDLRITIEDMIAEGDKVVVRTTTRGTHRGEFMGIAPTGRRVAVAGMEILRFAGGKVVEHWSISDDLGMMRQLGAVSTPGQSKEASPA